MEYMLMPFKRYFDFAGRSRRKEYWMFALLNLIVQTIFFFMLMSAGMSMGAPDAGGGGGAGLSILMLVLGVYMLIAIIPSLAVTVRRLHDTDRTGWFILVSFIPIIGGFILLYFMVIEGTRGPNKYGPDPKEGVPRGV